MPFDPRLSDDKGFVSPVEAAYHACFVQNGHSTPRREAARMIRDGGTGEKRARAWMAAEAEEEAASEAGHWDHNGFAVVTLNGDTPVIRLPLGFVKWSDGGPQEAMRLAIAKWLAGRAGEPQ